MTHQEPAVQGCNSGEGALGASTPSFIVLELKAPCCQFCSSPEVLFLSSERYNSA